MAVMAKKATDKHLNKPFQLRMHRQLREQLELLSESKLSDLSQEIREAIRKHLEQEGYWPPSPGKASK